jgi:hypothetical protein
MIDPRLAEILRFLNARLSMSAVLVAIVSACSTPKLDQAKFEAVHRSGRLTRENVGGGVTLLKYRELVGAYATDVSLANDHASTDLEREFVALHQAALKSFKDSLKVWGLKLAQGGNEITSNIDENSIGLEKIADEYSIAGKSVAPTLWKYSADAIIQAAWQRAAAKLDAADTRFRGESR